MHRKRAVLVILLHFLETYKGILQEEEKAGKVIKDLYLLIMKDSSLYHKLEDEILKLHQLVETVELKLLAVKEATVRTGHRTTDWFKIEQGVWQGCILSPCLFNLYAEHIMRKAELDESPVGIKIAWRNINNLRYADDTTLMAESEEELKSLLMWVKEESAKVGLKLNVKKTKIMASVFCRVYMPDHSYVTIRSRLSASVQDILTSVTEKLQYSDEQPTREEALILVAVASSGGNHPLGAVLGSEEQWQLSAKPEGESATVFSQDIDEKSVLQPNEECVFTTLGINSHLFACTKDTFPSLVPLPDEIQVSPGDTEIHRVEAEDVANHLTAFHWELFRCVHELEFVDYVFHGERGRRETANLELLLQRCSEVQHWVATEVLLCESLGKRAHLLKKFIKVAAVCKQNQDMLTFYAVVIGLNNAPVSRLRLTWEKLPGKFKNLFRKFENLTDPCRNHKSYREILSRMKPPIIPFVPLILKDLTFLHEASKTLVDGLVNVEKLHSVAEKVRTIRKCRSRPLCLEMESSPQQLQTKAYVRQFQVIDNQNLLFELSHKLESNSQ
ncbi:Rap guanine nucleotide exchange factor-like 1 [Varanus komodoensis]|nr:Rap guanine nucleotide exchange factor-like 1 [Varanus komodoensis]